MAENILKTRLQLKYDTIENWMKDSLILKKGEVAVATIPSSNSTSGLTPPAIGIKVGDGVTAFSGLNWIQAIAGDVPGWAKEADHATINTAIQNAIKNVTDGLNVSNTTSVPSVELITSITTQNGKITGYTTTPITTNNITVSSDSSNAPDGSLTKKLAAMDAATVQAKEDAISTAAQDAQTKANTAKTNAVAEAKTYTDNTVDAAKTAVINAAANDATSKITAAKSVLLGTASEGTDTIGTVKAAAAAAQTAADNAASAASTASAKVDTEIGKLDYTDAADNTQFVSKIDETDGIIKVTRVAVTDVLGIDSENGAYNKSTNKLATVATVTNKVNAVKDAILEDIGEISGAMRFRGTVSSNPTTTVPSVPSDGMGEFRAGDVLVSSVDSREFIYNGTTWEELGSEGIYAIKSDVESSITNINNNITGLGGRVDTLETDNTNNKNRITALENAGYTTKEYVDNEIDTIEGIISDIQTELDGIPGQISSAQAAAQTYATNLVNGLDVTDANANTSTTVSTDGFVSAVTQADGKIQVTKSKIKVAHIDDMTTTALGDSATDSSFALKGYVDSATKNVDDSIAEKITTEINKLDSSISATSASGNQVYVLTGVTQTDGKLNGKAETQLAAIAKTGNVADLQQTDTILVFDCGNASDKIY